MEPSSADLTSHVRGQRRIAKPRDHDDDHDDYENRQESSTRPDVYSGGRRWFGLTTVKGNRFLAVV
jgi:hypothetical protein